MSDVSLSHDLVLEGLEPGVAGSVAGTCCEVIGHKRLWSAIALSISCAFQEALQAQRAEISTLRDLGQCWSNRSAGSWAEDGPQARFTVKEASNREQWETEGTPASPPVSPALPSLAAQLLVHSVVRGERAQASWTAPAITQEKYRARPALVQDTFSLGCIFHVT